MDQGKEQTRARENTGMGQFSAYAHKCAPDLSARIVTRTLIYNIPNEHAEFFPCTEAGREEGGGRRKYGVRPRTSDDNWSGWGGGPVLGARRTGSNAHTCYLWSLGQFTVSRRGLAPESVKQGFSSRSPTNLADGCEAHPRWGCWGRFVNPSAQ